MGAFKVSGETCEACIALLAYTNKWIKTHLLVILKIGHEQL